MLLNLNLIPYCKRLSLMEFRTHLLQNDVGKTAQNQIFQMKTPIFINSLKHIMLKRTLIFNTE